MAITSYGKITIIDVTDIGNFSVYPYANGPNTQVYNEEDSNYYPNWATNPLVLTPVVTYAGQDVTSEATVNWYLKTDLTRSITTGFSSSNKTLTINTNIPIGNTYIVYVVKASYETDTGAHVEAEGEITFNLLTQHSSVKNVSISGNNVIKYASDSMVPNPSQVQLTANLTGGVNITGNGWKYYDGSAWSTNYISNSGTGQVNGLTVSNDGRTLTVNASPNKDAAYFDGDIARFKYIAHATFDATDLYEDIFSVFQLRDGSSGSSLVTMDLTNDNQLVPLNASNAPQWETIGDLASTTVYVYRGADDITSENPITVTLSNINEVELYNGNTKYANSWNGGTLPTNYYKIKVKSFSNNATSGSITFNTTVYNYSKTDDISIQSGKTYYSKNNSTGIYSAVANPSGNPYSQGWYVRGTGKPCSVTFSLTGVPAGENGQTPTIYSLEFPDGIPMYKNTPTGSAASQNLTDNFAFSPNFLKLQAYEIVTNPETGISSKNPFAGRVLYKPNIVDGEEKTGDLEWGVVDLNSTTGQYIFSNLSNAPHKFPVAHSPYTFKLVTSADTSTILDQETINISSDGKIGNAGNNGNDAINLLIDNENITLNATESGQTRAQTLTIGYQGYVGATEDSNFALVAPPNHFSSGKTDLVSGTNLVSSVVDNQSHNQVTITLNSGVSVSEGETGTITLNFVYTDTSVTPNTSTFISKTISWNAKLDAKDGESAIYLTFEYGGHKTTYFKNGDGSTKVTPVLIQNGTNLLTGKTVGTDYTVVWTDLISNNTVTLDSDNITAIITAASISGIGSYSCDVTYPKTNGKTYTQYISFTDYSDPLQVELISTIGDKLTNGIGEGVVYPQTTRNGITLDQVSSNSLVVWGYGSAPASPKQGDAYFNTANNNLYKCTTAGSWGNEPVHDYDQIIVLMSTGNPIVVKELDTSTNKYSKNSEFSSITNNLSYKWSFRDANGDVINPNTLTNLKVSYVNSTTAPTITSTQITGGQFVYINKDVVNKKIVILCQVTKS